MLDSVISDIASAIHVRHVQTPISHARRITGQDAQADVLTWLKAHQFDAAPIFGDADGGGVEGWVGQGHLTAQAGALVGDSRQDLTAAVLIDGSAALTRLLERFARAQSFLLVVGATGITGIVTPSDLNKQAGRTHLFMELSALELVLAQRLRNEPENSERWLSLLPAKRSQRVRNLHDKKGEMDEDADVVAAMDFRDLLSINAAIAPDEGAWRRLQGPAGAQEVETLARFRNRVMHAVLDVASDEAPRTAELVETTQLVTALLQPFISAGPTPGLLVS